MEATDYFKRWLPFYQATRHHIPEECNLYSHCRQNLKSHTLKYVHTSCKCLYILNGTPFPCTIITASYLAPISEKFYCDVLQIRELLSFTFFWTSYMLQSPAWTGECSDMPHKTNSGWCDLSQICYDEMHWMVVYRGPVRYNSISNALLFTGVLLWNVGLKGLSLFLLDVTAEMLPLVVQG